MARGAVVRLDLGGLEDVAKSPRVRSAIHDAAEKVAEYARSAGVDVSGVPGEYAIPVKVYDDTTAGMRVDRAVSRVVLAHAAGLATQAKHGLLTKGAAAAGLNLTARGEDPNELVEYTTLKGVTRMATRAQAAAWMASRG